MGAFGITLLVLGIIFLVVLCSSIRIVRQASSVVVERLGKYYKTLNEKQHSF